MEKACSVQRSHKPRKVLISNLIQRYLYSLVNIYYIRPREPATESFDIE